ncbi:pyridine nucleotide-disulfide oxidoreductase-domain-containing protein [Syncephalastrum racemosum]|uniref:Pyridine nucleotide-disulfide oxidoreductase-domain-containing protein n=1 Tax=Syncephalastrum racemosum TaxID=13706 RepID=A0A1X2HEL8_SYNRA|nr:pyridine nucleotide-disulfide oxidoreductase-domain-containing protein [Syncephalastrum racemosum]
MHFLRKGLGLVGRRGFATLTSSTKRAKAKKTLWTLGGLGGVAGLTYYLLRDEAYVADFQDAHAHVPQLAIHPVEGGAKGLPIVTHQIDDDVERETNIKKPRLVVVGGGWGAVSVLKNIDKDKYNITLISDNNYFLFTPLLPSATVGTLEMRSLLEPLRKIALRAGAHFLEARAVDIDLENNLVEVQSHGSDGHEGKSFYVPYDRVILAVGSTSITHGVDGIEHTHRLKTIRDAMDVRRKVTSNVEKAVLPTTSPEERKRLLSFVVCGGGPTGVEFAAELYDWMNEDLVKWFPKLLREDISVTIIQSRDHILNTFDVQISEYAERRFSRAKIDVVTNARVSRIEPDKVIYKLTNTDPPVFKEVPYGLCMWSTGIAMTPFAERLAEKLGTQVHKRCIKTDEYLRVKGIPDGSVFAIGDCATIENPRVLEHIMDIFHKADKAHNGLLTFEEFCTAVHDIRTRFPLTEQHLGEMMELFNTYDKDKNGRLDLEEMRIMLHDIDQKMTHLPATAQVASQQGAYLGKTLSQLADSRPDKCIAPFKYNYLGTLAYLGNTAVGEFNWGMHMVGGLWAMYLWRSVYWSQQVSARQRVNLSIDWTKRALFGRDLSTI